MDTLASPYTSWSNLELILDLVGYKIHFFLIGLGR